MCVPRLERKSQFDYCMDAMMEENEKERHGKKPRTNLAIIHDFRSCISTFVRRDDLYQTTVTTVKSSRD